jgi:hypothetical protein
MAEFEKSTKHFSFHSIIKNCLIAQNKEVPESMKRPDRVNSRLT